MTETQLASLFPLLSPSFVIATHKEAMAKDGSISPAVIWRLGIHEWFTHLGFVAEPMIFRCIDLIVQGFTHDDELAIALIDHKVVVIGSLSIAAIKRTWVKPLFFDLSRGDTFDGDLHDISVNMETSFTLHTTPMMKRLNKQKDETLANSKTS